MFFSANSVISAVRHPMATSLSASDAGPESAVFDGRSGQHVAFALFTTETAETTEKKQLRISS